MPIDTLQDYLTVATQKAADDLIAAFHQLPEDKRAWTPTEKSRSALDQVAECAVMNGATVYLLQTRQMPESAMAEFFQRKADVVAAGSAQMEALLQENTKSVIATIRDFPTEDLEQTIPMPWGPQTLAEIASYPYWNMTYHLGQINYIGSLLDGTD